MAAGAWIIRARAPCVLHPPRIRTPRTPRYYPDMQPTWLLIGAINGFLAVAAGAFGAHGLKDLPAYFLDVFKVGAQYHMYHALAMVALALLPAARAGSVAGGCFLGGIVVFSGSLYALALTQQKWLGAITPIGGVLFLVGWAALAWYAWQRLAPR